jgi:hypothetical protein
VPCILIVSKFYYQLIHKIISYLYVNFNILLRQLFCASVGNKNFDSIRKKVTITFQITCYYWVFFLWSPPRTGTLSYRKPATAGSIRDSCCTHWLDSTDTSRLFTPNIFQPILYSNLNLSRKAKEVFFCGAGALLQSNHEKLTISFKFLFISAWSNSAPTECLLYWKCLQRKKPSQNIKFCLQCEKINKHVTRIYKHTLISCSILVCLRKIKKWCKRKIKYIFHVKIQFFWWNLHRLRD